MPQLFLQNAQAYVAWSSGVARYLTDYAFGNNRILPVAILCRLGNGNFTDTALFDTAAPWSVLREDMAQTLEEELGEPGELISVKTHMGPIKGYLRTLDIHLLADLGGTDIKVESTVLVTGDWSGPTVLGFHGFLEKLRFALDPGVAEGEEIIYFGPAGA